MLGLKPVRLIETHSEQLAAGLAQKLRVSERTCDFCKVPPEELRLTAAEVYRNLGERVTAKNRR